MADLVGQQLGNYRLIQFLGAGPLSKVYLGEHIYLGTQAAVKVLHPQLAKEDVEKFRAEVRITALLTHPNVVRTLEFGIEGNIIFFVIEYGFKGSLCTRHPSGSQLSPETILPYVQQVASALQYAHNMKVIHRDVKPENMLIGRNNEVLLGDFGAATIIQDSDSNSFWELTGTIAYMAPEQIQGKPCFAHELRNEVVKGSGGAKK